MTICACTCIYWFSRQLDVPKPFIKMIASAAKAGFPEKYIAYKGAHHAFDHPNLPIKTRISQNAKWKKHKKRYVTVGSNGQARESAVKKLKRVVEKAVF